MKIFYFLIISVLLLTSIDINAQVTGLSGWNIFIDPGHSQIENMGIYNYSEAQKVLRIGLNLRDLLLETTDIDTVYMSRTNDQQQVSLSQRTDLANSLGAAWYHSIHSDAGGPTANSTLLLWGQYSNGTEKIPNGGKAMSDVIVPILTAGYRIGTRGSWGDHDFYGTCPSTRPCPYLFINYYTNMPSQLSEAGFHTNPTQNQRNMNAKWKRLEAYTLYWSILEFFEIERPSVGIATGIISNIESGQPINGAVISLNGQVDTTDTYESLFHLYSSDPDQLHNGFYFLENLNAGTHSVTVEVEGFDPYAGEITIEDTFFNFKDIQMVSNIPPYISTISPGQNDSLYPGVENIGVIFNRPMDKASVESTLVISPSVEVNFIWSDGDRRVAITTADFSFNTEYQLTISGNAMDKYSHQFDGDGDGTGGDNFVLNFKTKVPDVIAPEVVEIYPDENQTEVELQPVIGFSFNEQINTSTLSGKAKVIRDSDQSNVSGILKHYLVNDRSVVNLFPSSPLAINENYTVILEPGVEDIFGNQVTDQYSFSFTIGNDEFTVVNNIDNFENGITNWWEPQQSGSTEGIITEVTNISNATNYFNYIAGGSKSLKLQYGWDTLASGWLIREVYTPTTPGFNSTDILQVYMFGDGTGNKFRFAVRDNTGTIEVSPWYSVDWIGWKLINWDMTNDGTGTWIGNGVLDDPLRFDSFQLTFEPGSNNIGEVYFDDFTVVDKTTVGVDDEISEDVPSDYTLEQNYPNPFNPITQIRFGIPEAGKVKLEVYNLLGQKIATLIDDEMSSGYHSVDFNGKDLSSGIYVYTLSVSSIEDRSVTSKKMILLK
jgi:N-acetylmuramoyl-L-alanine amidase